MWCERACTGSAWESAVKPEMSANSTAPRRVQEREAGVDAIVVWHGVHLVGLAALGPAPLGGGGRADWREIIILAVRSSSRGPSTS